MRREDKETYLRGARFVVPAMVVAVLYGWWRWHMLEKRFELDPKEMTEQIQQQMLAPDGEAVQWLEKWCVGEGAGTPTCGGSPDGGER